MEQFEFNNGYSISRVIKGGWQLSEGHSDASLNNAISDMHKYVEAGINTFDCADIYTGVEELIGAFLRSYRKKYGTARAARIKIHTKFVPDLDMLDKVNEAYVRRIIERSLDRLSLDSLQLLQFHWWDYKVPGAVETLKILQKLQKQGLIQNLGLTNFNTEHLRQFSQEKLNILTNQVQYSLLDSRPETEMSAYAEKSGMKLLCYGTVAGGLLSNRYLGKPELSEPYENRSLRKYKLIIDDFGGWELFQELLQTLQRIAQKHSVDIATVASRYVLERPQVAAVIIGVRNSNHLAEQQKLFSFALDEDDYNAIGEVKAKSANLAGDCFDLERDKESKHGSIMKYNLNKR